jgi:3-isopropylmalate dehydratase small subunit
MDTIRGRARKFGDNIDTDTITPGAILQLPIDEIAKHAFEPITPAFYQTVKKGDIIVAGTNYGCGSSREHATEVIKELGIGFIVCESMARIYFRNCIALGVYPVLAKGVSSIVNEGDEIEIDLHNGVVKNVKTGKTASFKPLTGTPKQILDGGGILPFLKKITEES